MRGDWTVVLHGLASGHLPDDGSEVFAVFLHFEEDASAVDGGFDFGSGADDAWIFEETQDVFFLEASDLPGVELFEGGAEGFALAEDGDPGEAGLEAFEHQEFPKGSAVVLRDAPLFVVVGAHEGIVCSPGAADFVFFRAHAIHLMRREKPRVVARLLTGVVPG